MGQEINIVGQRFGRLVVKAYIGYDNKNETTLWLCECNCEEGKTKIISKKQLRHGTKSCGCLIKENASKNYKKYNKYNLDGNYGIGYDINNKEFYFDLDDFDKIKNICWNINKNNRVMGRDCVTKKTVSMHKIIMNSRKNQIIDHIDRDPRNNRKSNLRFCLHKENIRNSSKSINNTTGFTGVYFYGEKYRPRIEVDGIAINLGSYEDITDAIFARLKAEKEYFGEFAPQKHLFLQYGII